MQRNLRPRKSASKSSTVRENLLATSRKRLRDVSLDEVSDDESPNAESWFDKIALSIIHHIFSMLTEKEKCVSARVCKQWRSWIYDHAAGWKTLNLTLPTNVKAFRRLANERFEALQTLTLHDTTIAQNRTRITRSGSVTRKVLEVLPADRFKELRHLTIERSAQNVKEYAELFQALTGPNGHGTSLTSFTVRQSTGMSCIPRAICHFTQLTTLRLSGNSIGALPDELFMLSSLTELDVSDNYSLVHIPEAISYLTALRVLNVSECDLDSISFGVFQLTQLEVLDVSNNNIEQLPGQIGALCNLRKLSIQTNDMYNVPGEIRMLSAIEELNLMYNHLYHLPPELGALSSLTSLNLGHNDLDDLPRQVSSLVNLRHLDLRFNNLTRLPTELTQLHALQVLNLEGNDLYGARFPVAIKRMLDRLDSWPRWDGKTKWYSY